MKEWFKKIKLNITLFFHGLFQGLRSADETMLSQVSGEEQDGQEAGPRTVVVPRKEIAVLRLYLDI